MDMVDSGVEQVISAGSSDGAVVSPSTPPVGATGTTTPNLHNANNLPKDALKQVEQFEADLQKNPKDTKALLGWARLLVKVARDVIQTHTSPDSVKNVRIYSSSSSIPPLHHQPKDSILI
jgi:hypothetical protein